MYGLSSCLPQPFDALVEANWRELERELGLTGILETAFSPHFTWLLAEGRDFERAWAIVSAIAQGIEPFALRTTGLGLFINDKIVVHVPIVKTAGLVRLHALFWEGLAEASTVRYTLYAPEAWMPHVSLVHEELEPGLVRRVMERLAGRAFDWEMVIDNVVLVDEVMGARAVRFGA